MRIACVSGPSRRSTCFLSPPVTSAPRPRRRVRRLDFFSSRCERNALRRRILPVPVTLNRLAAPRCVFIFGIIQLRVSACGRGRRAPLGRSGRLAAGGAAGRPGFGFARACGLRPSWCGCSTMVMLRPSWRGADSTIAISLDLVGDPLEDLQPELRVGHLATPEHDRQLDLVALGEEALDVLHLRRVVVLVDLGPELHLLDDDLASPSSDSLRRCCCS